MDAPNLPVVLPCQYLDQRLDDTRVELRLWPDRSPQCHSHSVSHIWTQKSSTWLLVFSIPAKFECSCLHRGTCRRTFDPSCGCLHPDQSVSFGAIWPEFRSSSDSKGRHFILLWCVYQRSTEFIHDPGKIIVGFWRRYYAVVSTALNMLQLFVI